MEAPAGWRPAERTGFDLVDVGGRIGVELKPRAQGIRDLNAAVMQLAVGLITTPEIEQALLVVHVPRMTAERIRMAWKQALDALRPNLARRLFLCAVGEQGVLVEPDDPALVAAAHVFADQLRHAWGPALERSPAKRLEVAKVLLVAWMRREGPLQIQTIEQRVGCSYPTAASALDALDARRELTRTRDRRVELRALPQQTLEELIVRTNTLRNTSWLIDLSGRTPDPELLLRRLRKAKLPRLALGGVLAARHYQPSFDLHGIPRIDITAWVPPGFHSDVSSLAQLDPGLALDLTKQSEAIIAVHRLARADALFEGSGEGVPYADPVETLLDLLELRLPEQADAFVRHMRGGT